MQTSILALAATILASGSLAVPEQETFAFTLYNDSSCNGTATDSRDETNGNSCMPFPAGSVSIDVTDDYCLFGYEFGVSLFEDDACATPNTTPTGYDSCSELNITAGVTPKSYKAGCIVFWDS